MGLPMITLSDLATIERIQAIEGELARLRADAYVRAGIPMPAENARMKRLVEMAAVTFNVPPATITGPIRSRKYVQARFAVMWVAREVFALSTPVIGRALGNRDHSTVLAGLSRCEEWRDADPDYREITDRLLAIFQPKQAKEAEHAASSH